MSLRDGGGHSDAVDKNGSLLIYGATGYTGKLLVQEALRRGLDPILAGRSADRLRSVAQRCGSDRVRAFSLDDPDAIRSALDGVSCVLHAAGPFAMTAEPMMEASILTATHYLDITGELSTFELAESLSVRAGTAGIMLLPGVGWDVIPSDAVASHTAQRVELPQSLRLFLRHSGKLSRGSLASSGYIIADGLKVRRGGQIVIADDAQPMTVDFGLGPEVVAPMAMGDIVTAFKSFHVPNISVFLAAPDVDLTSSMSIEDLPEGPTAEERDAGRSKVIAEVTGADGTIASSMIETPSTYAFTCRSAIEVAVRVLAGAVQPGFQSPMSAYGPELALSVGDSTIVDL